MRSYLLHQLPLSVPSPSHPIFAIPTIRQRCRALPRHCFALVILISLWTAAWGQARESAAASNDGRISFQILDSQTGYAVGPATIKYGAVGASSAIALPNSGTSTSDGSFAADLNAADYAFEVLAPGYRPLRTHFDVAIGATVRANINLDPESAPPELAESTVSPQLRDGFDFVHGYVVDAVTHLPVNGVSITTRVAGITTTSDSRGYFQFYAAARSTAGITRPEDFPASDTLIAAAAGYKLYSLSGLLYVPGNESAIRIELTPGSGNMHEQIHHMPLELPGPVPDVPSSTAPVGKPLLN